VYEVMSKLAKERRSAIEQNKRLLQELVWNLFGTWSFVAIYFPIIVAFSLSKLVNVLCRS
jgi:hypothetical protein